MSSELSRFKVRFVIEGVGEAAGELVRFLAPRTVETLMKELPIEGRAAIWKEQIYFETKVEAGPEKERTKVESGTIAYWPLGSAICVFFGSSQPYGPVNPVGRITEGLELFRKVRQGSRIRLERV
jgi:hypothetical protein